MKPEYLPDSLDSIIAQTRTDIQVIVVDSGEWFGKSDPRSQAMAATYDAYSNHPFIEWFSLGEPPALITRRCPISYIINETLRKGLVRGKYMCIFTDDDLYHPQYIEKMAGFLDAEPDRRAVYCAQDRVFVAEDGTRTPERVISADVPRHGAAFDNHIDMLQMMFHTSLLAEIGDPWFDENPEDGICRHSDGLFMNRIGEIIVEVPNVPDILVTHQFTPLSTYN